VWRAVNHGITASSTGGFSITEDSAGSASPGARVVIAATLLMSALSFGTIWDRVTRNGVPLWQRTQIRYGVGATVIAALVAIVVADGVAVVDVVFNSISASTTGGFDAGTSYREIEALAAVAMVSMFVGGAAGSTAGGIKVARLAWLTKASAHFLPDARHDNDTSYVWDGEQIEPDVAHDRIMGAATIVVVWLAMLAVGSVILAVHNPAWPLADVVFEAISAGSGVGLSSGLTSATADAATKATLAALMLAGRVEMTAFVVMALAPFVEARHR
jgi:trk system potassium uptake protein